MTNGARRFRVLVIEHERETPGGHVQRLLERRASSLDVLPIDVETAIVPAAADYDLIVSLGSEFSAADDFFWIDRELELIADADRSGTPILGICFGGQLLARAFGGEVVRSEQSEIGWLPIGSRDPMFADEPWFQWHFDTFTVPPGGITLAANEVGPQAFRIGPHLGVQFHPEVDNEIMEGWVVAFRHELDDNGVDPELLLAETRRLMPVAEANTERFLDACCPTTLAGKR